MFVPEYINMPNPFSFTVSEGEDPKEKFNFSMSSTADGRYVIVSTFSEYIKPVSDLASRLLGCTPNAPRWEHKHIFRQIHVTNEKSETFTLQPDSFETTLNNYLFIFKNTMTLNKMGDAVLVNVKEF